MKLNVIVDRDGVIVGTAPAAPKVEGKDAPKAVSMTPAAGRLVHKVDVPQEAVALSAGELSRRFRLSLRGKPKMVRVREPKPVPAPAPTAPEKSATRARKAKPLS
jgi:hypothetical protein